jgi:pimeloyl-ACP methyl ester carboxylesterase
VALRALLLPGLDGSGRLFAPLLAAGPRVVAPEVLPFPADAPLGYDELLPLVRAALPRDPFLIVAESFSGPLAVRIAAERPTALAGLVLAATFLHRPLHPILHAVRGLVGARLLGLRMPAGVVRHLMAGRDAPDAIVHEVQEAVAAVRPEVLAMRSREALGVDVRDALRAIDVPILVLQPRRDRLIRTDVAREVAEIRPDAEIAVLDAPHMILQRAPHACLARIEAFADRVSPGAPRAPRAAARDRPPGPATP